MKPHGQVRRGQLLNTFGPGALIDLPKQAVLVGGLDHWRWITPVRAIAEPRLLQKIRRFLPEVRELREPPVDPDPDQPGGGVTVWQFPEWFITQDILHTHPRYGRSRRLVHRRLVQKNQFEDEDRKKHPVVPVRFVRACPKGHIGDIDWYAFVHEEATACRRNLWIDEQGTSGDIASASSAICICFFILLSFSVDGTHGAQQGHCYAARRRGRKRDGSPARVTAAIARKGPDSHCR